MKYEFEQLDKNNEKHVDTLKQVSAWSKDHETMKNYEESELSQHPLSIVAFDNQAKELAGHVAVTEISELNQKKIGRIGALAVAQAIQGNGVGTGLIRHLLKIAEKKLPEIDSYYAFVHPGSLKAFLDNGAQIVGPRVPEVSTGCNIIVSLDVIGINSNE